MQPSENKEVYFHEYCCKCINKDVIETDEPCNECLTNTTNLYSHKPIKFKEDPDYERKRRADKKD